MASINYSFDEFRNHVSAMKYVLNYENVTRGSEQAHIGSEKCFELNVLRVMDYMQQVYTDPEEQMHKGKMLMLMMRYLSKHVDDFDTGDYAVQGSDRVGALASEHLLKAVHHIFTTCAVGDLGAGPDPTEVMALADKYREE